MLLILKAKSDTLKYEVMYIIKKKQTIFEKGFAFKNSLCKKMFIF